MLEAAQTNIEDVSGRFQFQIADVEEMPFLDHVFDMLIANHLLFYFQTKDRVFAEIRRVLVKNGTGYASTVSVNSLQELLSVIMNFDRRLSFFDEKLSNFSIENGKTILSSCFNVIDRYIYQNDLVISI